MKVSSPNEISRPSGRINPFETSTYRTSVYSLGGPSSSHAESEKKQGFFRTLRKRQTVKQHRRAQTPPEIRRITYIFPR